MLSEPALDLIALGLLVATVLAWARVFLSYRKTPDDWVGPQNEFAARLGRERFWTGVGWVTLALGCLVTAIDLVAN